MTAAILPYGTPVRVVRGPMQGQVGWIKKYNDTEQMEAEHFGGRWVLIYGVDLLRVSNTSEQYVETFWFYPEDIEVTSE